MRRLILGIDGRGKVDVKHDNFSAGELATLFMVVFDLAMETLKNGPSGNIPESSANDSGGGG